VSMARWSDCRFSAPSIRQSEQGLIGVSARVFSRSLWIPVLKFRVLANVRLHGRHHSNGFAFPRQLKKYR
jgi:hypothetical protein